MKDNITHKMVAVKTRNKKGKISRTRTLFFEEDIKQIDFENKVLWLRTGEFMTFESAEIEYHYPPDISEMKICKKLD